MKASYRYFENRACQYYPCHAGTEELNCLFCYCPFYLRRDCPGEPAYIKSGEKLVKDCSACIWPHQPEHYDAINAWIAENNDFS